MKTRPVALFLAGTSLLAIAASCTPQKQVTERDRKEAAHLASEAQFAMALREWSRAEGLLAKAVQVAPTGDTWVNLGAVRVKLNQRAGARHAYQAALKAYEMDTARRPGVTEPWIRQAFVLALLGRREDARAVLERAVKVFPKDTRLRALTTPAEFEKMTSTREFKDMAL
jgi:tetratricopeptide (TPR) repeat protein